MKAKALIAGAVMIISSILFVACGKAEDGKITTTTPATTKSSVVTTTRKGVMGEMSSIAGDVSEGLSEAGSELKKGITRMYE